jgi:hypothetical protein
MAEQRVDRRHSAAQRRMIDGVVVHQRREMHQLDDRGVRRRPRLRLSFDFARQQRQRRPEHLSAHAQEMVVDFADEAQLGGDDAADFVGDALEGVVHGRLDVAQRGRRGARRCRAHAVTRSSAEIRSLTSRNSMSTANTRW